MDDAAAPATPAPELEKPQGRLNAILATLPVALAALATAFAGMSSSEMTQAMYHRSLAAQHQSKAGDQWAFFQAKRTRGTSYEMTAELLDGLGYTQPESFDPVRIDAIAVDVLTQIKGSKSKDDASAIVAKLEESQRKLRDMLANKSTQRSLHYLMGSTLPNTDDGPNPVGDAMEKVLVEIRHRKTEAETAAEVRQLNPEAIEQATRRAEEAADKFDSACEPITAAIKQMRPILVELHAVVASLRPKSFGSVFVPATLLEAQEKGFRVAVLEFEAKRFRHEASLNRAAAELYELRVRRSAVESDRHRERSEMFFYSMLLAQMGVTVASLALAQRTRKSLWFFAAFAGMISLCFSGYIYLTY
jgi:hypothetical protein